MSEQVKPDKYKNRRWRVPSKRAKKYVEDRKAKVHTAGPKEGQPLTDFEAGVRPDRVLMKVE